VVQKKDRRDKADHTKPNKALLKMKMEEFILQFNGMV